MSSKFGFSSRYENLAKELVHHILGLRDEDDENFAASMDFVMSNLLYHHYLDVNSHTVQRSLEGVSFKMIVHGHQKKAEQLQTLITKFFSLPDVEEKGDLKWSILSLLNELSQHPARDSLTASFVTDIDESLESSSKADTITDWLGDLMEKSFQYPDKDDTLSEWSDDDDTLRHSYCSGIEHDAQQQRPQKQLLLKEQKPLEEFHLKAPLTPIKEREKRNALLKAAQDSKSWFASSVQKPYWKVNKSRFHAPGSDNIVLTEYVVMRECIWLLLHPSSGFLFRKEGDKFIITEPVILSTLGKSDLKPILESFALVATKLYTIDKWLNDIKFQVLNDVSGCHENLGGTLLSYADGLREWRAEYFDDVLNHLEKTIFAQEGCQTLLWLMEELRDSYSTLEAIYNVHSNAFSSSEDHRLFKSLRLLSLLTQGIESGLKICDQKCLLILFQYSIKGYLKTIYSLLWGVGSPSPHALEDFGIITNRREEDGTVKKYVLQDLKIFSLPGLSFLSTMREILLEVCELREIVPKLNFEEDKCSDFLEKLVQDQINSVYFPEYEKYQGRTLELNNNNNNNNTCLENTSIEVNSTAEGVTTSRISTQNNKENNSDLEGYLENACENFCVRETPEINAFLTKAFSLDEYECNSQETLIQQTAKKVFEKKNFKDCKGLDYLLKSTLLPVIQKRQNYISRFLLETLSKSYGLRRQLKVLVSAVLLDSSCAAMQEFYSYLFHKMDSKEGLDEGDLTQNFQFCLGVAYPDIAPYFNIVFPQHLKSVSPSDTFSKEEVLSSLSLDFSDLWPLCIVLKRSHIIKYTKIFQFCLMLRRASFTIERLHFKEIGSHFTFENTEDSFTALDRQSEDGHEDKGEPLPLAHRIHRLQLLRQWVLYFARILRDHFSSAVFVPFSAKIEELLDKSNFSDFKQEHEVLLSKTFHECLLDEETLSPIQTTLMQLFLTVERIHDLWIGPPHGIQDAELDMLEEKYSSCHRLVANFLSALASVKYCPLVDGLAQCLMYNCPT